MNKKARYYTYLQPDTKVLYVRDTDNPSVLFDPYGRIANRDINNKTLQILVKADLLRLAWSTDEDGNYID